MTPYRVIVADPPWQFGDKLPGVRGAESHYECMDVDQLYRLKLPPIADDALLFFWRVAAMQEEALAVMHMWGFDLKSEMVWVKTKNGVLEDVADPESDLIVDENDLAFGMGRYTRACHEVCLIGTRGKAASQVVKNHSVRSVFFAERGEHSAKPEKFYSLVEKLVDGEGPFLELFARKQRAGWTCIGDALGTKLEVIDGSRNSTADGSGNPEDPSAGREEANGEGGGRGQARAAGRPARARRPTRGRHPGGQEGGGELPDLPGSGL